MWKQKLEAEAVEAVKFLWKRKHFDEKDWKRKRSSIRKRSIGSDQLYPEPEAEAKNYKGEEAEASSEA